MEVTNDHLLSLHAREACTLLGYIHDLTPMDGRCACGLRNIGNTCYANAILACFSQVVALRKWTAQHKALCREEHAHPPSCVLCSLAEDLQRVRFSSTISKLVDDAKATVQSTTRTCIAMIWYLPAKRSPRFFSKVR